MERQVVLMLLRRLDTTGMGSVDNYKPTAGGLGKSKLSSIKALRQLSGDQDLCKFGAGIELRRTNVGVDLFYRGKFG